jgi:hypothetical protein
MAAELSAESAGGSGAGLLILVLIAGVGLGMMVQRFTRSRKDLKGARSFAKSASKAHWRGSFPRLVLWAFIAVSVVVALFRLMFSGD